MSVSVQESLLDLGGDGPALGPLGSSVARTPLARGAWVDFCPGWLAGSAEGFARLGGSGLWGGGGGGRGGGGGGGRPPGGSPSTARPPPCPPWCCRARGGR